MSRGVKLIYHYMFRNALENIRRPKSINKQLSKRSPRKLVPKLLALACSRGNAFATKQKNCQLP